MKNGIKESSVAAFCVVVRGEAIVPSVLLFSLLVVDGEVESVLVVLCVASFEEADFSVRFCRSWLEKLGAWLLPASLAAFAEARGDAG